MKKIIGLFAVLFLSLPALANQLDQITPNFKKVRYSYDAKHTPKIEAPDKVKAGEWFDVKITIGAGGEHPSLMEHHVHWIALYKNDVELARVYLNAVQAKPQVTFTIALDESTTLKVMEEPNHTAPWVAMKNIRVEK
ncbi:MAG: desulfoferrodoxin family protein [Deltaproteobacteria bacterium]|nr:desulfoferrodoxin family protein [Deltaproteobacteria bacterium]